MNTLSVINVQNNLETLDSLWAKAEQLGKISIDHKIGEKEYRAEIFFYDENGSSIYARFESWFITDAISGAIKIALGYGAKPKERKRR